MIDKDFQRSTPLSCYSFLKADCKGRTFFLSHQIFFLFFVKIYLANPPLIISLPCVLTSTPLQKRSAKVAPFSRSFQIFFVHHPIAAILQLQTANLQSSIDKQFKQTFDTDCPSNIFSPKSSQSRFHPFLSAFYC